MRSIANMYVLKLHIKRLILIFMAGLVISGVTALPLEWQLKIAHQWIQRVKWNNVFSRWLECTYSGVHATNDTYPFLAYGTDWLGFAHLVIAIAFIGPWRDPIKNKWVIEFGLIACVAILPFAFIAGTLRGIPVFWTVVDCMFGIVGGLVLWRCYKKIKHLERAQHA